LTNLTSQYITYSSSKQNNLLIITYITGDFMKNTNITNKIWLSNKIFEIYSPCSGGTVVDSNFRKRAYHLWHHANDLIQNATNDFQLEDGIIDLKRALNHRLKLIEELYGFKKNILEYKNTPYLEILAKLSIIRPSLLKKLLIIRNNIEHNDDGAPEQERCLELSDVVWYFLKSTDQMCNFIYEDIEFIDTNNDSLFFDITVDYQKPLNISIRGLLDKQYLSFSYEESFLEINIQDNMEYIDTDNISFNGYLSKNFEQTELLLKLLFNVCT